MNRCLFSTGGLVGVLLILAALIIATVREITQNHAELRYG